MDRWTDGWMDGWIDGRMVIKKKQVFIANILNVFVIWSANNKVASICL